MRKLVALFSVLLLLFASCNKSCKIKYPKNLKQIDWENYNDVHTVYWNLVHCCSETINLQSDTIMISGWKPSNFTTLSLCDYPNTYYGDGTIKTLVHITCYLPEFKEKLDTSDLTKKCYIKGKILLQQGESYSKKDCKVVPKIKITNINDIYFK